MKRQFGEMQSKMQQDMNAYSNQQASGQPKQEKAKEDDYIEFEEIKK